METAAADRSMRTAIGQCYVWSMDYNISVNRENTTSIPRERTSNASLVKRIKILVHDLGVYGNLIKHNS